MAEPFRGTVNVDIRDSEPDWTPFEPHGARGCAERPVHRPRRRRLLGDDGYGGPIETPNIDRIAAGRGALHAVAHHGAVLANALRAC